MMSQILVGGKTLYRPWLIFSTRRFFGFYWHPDAITNLSARGPGISTSHMRIQVNVYIQANIAQLTENKNVCQQNLRWILNSECRKRMDEDMFLLGNKPENHLFNLLWLCVKNVVSEGTVEWVFLKRYSKYHNIMGSYKQIRQPR